MNNVGIQMVNPQYLSMEAQAEVVASFQEDFLTQKSIGLSCLINVGVEKANLIHV